MKKPKLTILEYSLIAWIAFVVIGSVMIVTSDPPKESFLQRVGKFTHEIEHEFKKGYNQDSIRVTE